MVEHDDDLKVHNDQAIDVDRMCTYTEGDSITLGVGGSSIKINEEGVTITAPKVSITGETNTSITTMTFRMNATEVDMDAVNVNIIALTSIDGVPGFYIPA